MNTLRQTEDRTLHTSLVVIDGLSLVAPVRANFEDMVRGGLTAANVTCCVWEGFVQAMGNIAHWKKLFAENADLIRPVRTTDDILAAKKEGRVGIILGWQNTSGIEDRPDYLPLFHDVGVRIVQLTYNTLNYSGAGCFEENDPGLSGFGREVVDQLNDLGMVIDLSHVGSKTASDTIAYSKTPVCYSHICPQGMKDHPRNKSDDQLKEIADHGGFVGMAMFPTFLPKGPQSTLDDYVDTIDYAANLIGLENIGFGSDFTNRQPDEVEEWCMRDKGVGRVLAVLGDLTYPEGIRTCADFPNLTARLSDRGWSDEDVAAVMGGNWLRFLKSVWGA